MHLLIYRRRRRDIVLCLSLLLFLPPVLVVGQTPAAFTWSNSQVHHSGDIAGSGNKVPPLGTWDSLSLCIKHSKEKRALERWLLCVEAVASGSDTIGAENEMSREYDELSTLGKKINVRESPWFRRMELERPNDQLELSTSGGLGSCQLQMVQGRQDGSENGGGLGLFKMDDVAGSTGISPYDQRVCDPGEVDAVTPLVEESHRGSVSGISDEYTSVAHDGASDSAGKSREDFLSYRGDQIQVSASDCSDEVDQVLADFKSGEGMDESQRDAENDNPVADSATIESSNTCNSGFFSSQEGRIAERINLSSTPEQETRSHLKMKDAIASSAVVCLLTLMLRAQRGRGGRRFQEQREISTPRSKLPVESNTFEIERKFPNDTLKLSQPLGMAVAQVFYEILEQNGDHSEGSLSAESLSKLLESALKESLMPVLGNDRFQFVEKFRDSFSSTYRTRATVRSTYEKAGMRETEARPYWGTHWRGSQPKSRRESHKHQYSDNVERHAKGREVNKRSIKPGAAGQTKACAVNDEEQVSVSRFKQGNSFFFSTSNHEQGGRSDCGESSTGRFLDENFLSVTSQLESCSQENYKFPVGEECSQDEQMYSADDSSEHEDWIVLERRASTSQAVLDDGLSSYHSLECDESLKDQDFNTRELVNTQKNPEPSSCSGGVVGCSMDSDWRGESSSCQGIATPRSGFCDETLDHGNYLDFPRSSRLNHDMDISFRGCLTDSLQQLGKPQVPRLIRSEDSRRGRGEGAFKRPPVSGDVSDRMMRPQARRGVTESSGLSVQDALVVARSPNVVGFKAAGEDRNDLLERSVAAQEQHNQLLAWDLHCRSQGLVMKQEHLHLQYESNTLLKENVELSRVKAEFKENELQDRKLSLAYSEFSRTCADQLVAGLCVMLVVLGFSFWKFSYERLAGVVTVCNPPNRETHQSGWLGTNWMYNSLNAFTFQIQALTCEITKAGRMVVGLIIIAFVTSSLLRRSVTSSSQAMPATIIVIVLGGICGFAGKISVDSLGGSGLHWLVLWECLCFLHAFATCFPPLLYHLLNGPPQRNYFEKPSTAYRISSGISRFVFHTILVFILPFMAGVLPFASPEEIMQIFLDWSSPVTFHGKYRVHV